MGPITNFVAGDIIRNPFEFGLEPFILGYNMDEAGNLGVPTRLTSILTGSSFDVVDMPSMGWEIDRAFRGFVAKRCAVPENRIAE